MRLTLCHLHPDHPLYFYKPLFSPLFFFNYTATTEIYTLSLHDALPISRLERGRVARERVALAGRPPHGGLAGDTRYVEHALHHRHRGGERQNDDDPKQQRSVVPGPEE